MKSCPQGGAGNADQGRCKKERKKTVGGGVAPQSVVFVAGKAWLPPRQKPERGENALRFPASPAPPQVLFFRLGRASDSSKCG